MFVVSLKYNRTHQLILVQQFAVAQYVETGAQTHQVSFEPLFPWVLEYKDPTRQAEVFVGEAFPFPQVGALGLVVKREYPRVVLPLVTASPITYMATVVSETVVLGVAWLSWIVATPDTPPLLAPRIVTSVSVWAPEMKITALVIPVPPVIFFRRLLDAL
jgi:hypothetical protein